jgi:hypothetical protein
MQRSPVHGGGAASTLASGPPGPASGEVPPDPAPPPLPPVAPPLPALPPLDPPEPPEPAFPPVDPPTPAPPPVAPAAPLAPPFPFDVPPPPLPVPLLDPPLAPDPPPPVDRIPSDSLPHPIATRDRAIQHRPTNAELNRQFIKISPRTERGVGRYNACIPRHRFLINRQSTRTDANMPARKCWRTAEPNRLSLRTSIAPTSQPRAQIVARAMSSPAQNPCASRAVQSRPEVPVGGRRHLSKATPPPRHPLNDP